MLPGLVESKQELLDHDENIARFLFFTVYLTNGKNLVRVYTVMDAFPLTTFCTLTTRNLFILI